MNIDSVYKSKPFYAFLCAFVLLLALPVIYGHLQSTPDNTFLGFTGLYPNEQHYYMSVGPSQALKGHILFADKYSRVPYRDFFLNPIANIIGVISLSLKIPLPLAFNIFRIIASIFLIYSIYLLSQQFTKNKKTQFFSVIIFCFSAGFNYYFNVVSFPGIDAIDDSIPEVNAFIAMSGEYYLPLANALFILSLTYAYRIFHKNEDKTWACGISLLLLGAIYIYGLVSAVAIIGFWGIINGFKDKEIVPPIKIFIKLALFCLPIVAYYFWLIIQFPSIDESGWYPPPSFGVTLCSFGFSIMFTLLGILLKGKDWNKNEFFLLLWISLTLCFIYLPQKLLAIQIQLFIGIGAPLAVLFASSLEAIQSTIIRVSKLGATSALRVITAIATTAIVIFSSATNINFYANQFSALRAHKFPFYMDRPLYKSMDWISQHISENKTIIVSRKLGFILSSVTACNVYCGVGSDTEITNEQKNTDTLLVYIRDKKQNQIQRKLKEINADYLFLDKSLAKDEFETMRLTLSINYNQVFENQAVSLFYVKEPTKTEIGFQQ